MRVLVDALPLRYGGGVTYLQHQLAALADVAPNLELHILVSPWSQLKMLSGTTEVVHVRSVPTRFAYELLRLPCRGADLLYCPANFGPVIGGPPMVLTLHNQMYYGSGLSMPETRSSRPWWKVKANYAAMRRADAIIALSHTSAEEVAASVPGAANKISVIYSGAPDWPEESIYVKGLPDKYVLTVTSSSPHKRLGDVLEGWARSQDGANEVVPLVIVGEFSDVQVSAHHAIAGRSSPHLIHLGQIRDRRTLKWIYEHATALVTMSVIESFAMTLSEAGAVGCPLVISDIPAHREMSMGNALTIPSRDVKALAEALKGEVYAGKPGSRPWAWPVTWDDNAKALSELFEKVAH